MWDMTYREKALSHGGEKSPCVELPSGFGKKYVNRECCINMTRKWAGLDPGEVRVNTACLKNRDGPLTSALMGASGYI